MDLWRQLRVGDKVRLVEIPPEFTGTGYYVHASTMRVYRKLVARGRPLRIRIIDFAGARWIRCRLRRKSGGWETHDLAFSHDGLVKVTRRKRT